MKSIIQDDRHCFLCGRAGPLERHHVFGGPNRHISEADGMIVYLCPECHRTGANAVHNNMITNLAVKQHAQRIWEAVYGSRAEFRARYGKNYLEGE